VVTRSLFSASSSRRESASSRSATLLAANADQPGIARVPGAALTNTTCPRLRRSAGSASLVSSAAAMAFTAIVSCHTAGPVPATGASASTATPAQCTSASSRSGSWTASASF
jgi:hypothetical protein